MSTASHYPHIQITDDGARIEGTRYKVQHLAAEHYQYGWSAEELLRQHPDLRPEQVYGALTFFYDHYDAIVHALKSESQESGTSPQVVSRQELLNRRRSGS